VPDLTIFLASHIARKLQDEGLLVRTVPLGPGETRRLLADPAFSDTAGDLRGSIYEHERIPFPSYPYEWAPEMLYAAGQLTLDLARQLLGEGYGLKDGTPYNVLFRGPQPVFVDVLSFERRNPSDPIWLSYAQFVRTFLLPLAAHKHFGLSPSHTLFTRRDGLEPEEVYQWLTPIRRLSPTFFSLVSMPHWLASKYDAQSSTVHQNPQTTDPAKARFILNHLFAALSRKLARLNPQTGTKSTWSEYMTSNNYTNEHFAAKETFVQQVMRELGPRRVLDVGCNTGHFSEIAANVGAQVVALDYDPVVVGEVWRRAKMKQLNILPLTVNLCRPSPAIGWRNEECSSFLDRSRGAFDCVLMLAVLHHMLVTERVPLPEIVDVVADLTTAALVIEFIGPEDSMFRRIARGRDALHSGLTAGVFEEAVNKRFDIVRTQHLPNTHRWLYLLTKKG
jgi:SAM-dependent methyltransferase